MVKMKKITVLILTLALAVAALVGVTATASADEEVTPVEATELTTFNMDHGASVRKVGMNGLRFSAKMSSAEYLGLVEQYGAENLSFGILIFPYDYLSEYDETSFTWGADADEKTYIGDKEIIDLRSPIMGDDGDYMTIAGSIINIKDKNLNRSFNGRAYVRYVEEGVAKYVFASLDENTRTMLYVAQKALKEDADLTDDDKDAINSTYLSEEKINGLKATYNVEVYYEESTDKNNVANYVLSDEDSFELTAQINAEISVEKRTFDDNTYVYVENENEKLSDVVMADGSSVLKVYYRKLYPYTVYVLGNKTYVGDEFDTADLSNFVIVEQNTKYGYAGQTVTENYQTYENSYRDNKGILLGYYTNSIATKTVTADGSVAIRLIFSINMVYRPEGANYRFYLKECDFRSDPIDTYAEIVDDPTVGTAIKFTTVTANDWYSRSTIIYLEDGKSGVSFNKTHNETLGYDRITYKLKFDAGATPEMFTYKGGTNIVKLKTDLADYSSVVKFYDLAAYKAGTVMTPVTSPVADTWYAVEVDISNAEYLTNATSNIINPTVNPVENTAMYIADFKITKSSEYTAEYKTAKYGEQLASKTAAELSMPSTVKVTPDGTVFNLPAKDGYRLLNYSIDKANSTVTFNYREIEYEEYTVNHYVVGESQPFATSTETGILGDSITAVKKTSRYYTYAQNESEVLSDTLTGEGKVLKVYYNKAADTALYSDDGKAAIAYGLVNTQNNSEWFASYQGVNDVIKVTRKATDTSTGANQWGARVPFATYANDHYDATKAQFDAAYGTDTYVVKVKMFYESSSHPFFNPFTTELGNGTANIYFYDASNNGNNNPDG
ncbi:MAG: hypothetical protein IJ800_01855, partial [Clostridia bacterium]|nr:hypothetical protein [Clostridia bacterium]